MNSNYKDTLIESLRSIQLYNNSSKSIVSYASPLKSINYNSLLNNTLLSEEQFFQWNKPSQSYHAFGYDILQPVVNNTNSYNEIKNNIIHNWSEHNLAQVPVVMGGIKFSNEPFNNRWNNFSYTNWFIPKLIFLTIDKECFIIFNFYSDSDIDFEEMINQAESLLTENNYNEESKPDIINSTNNDYDFHEWSSIINKSLKIISEKQISKIVISREVELEFDHAPYLPIIIDRLTARYPDCYIFLFRSGDSIFFGASPEKLISIQNDIIQTDALAGSIKRGITKPEDDQLAAALLSSTKNLAEQKAVTYFILNALSNHTTNIEYDDNPVIKKLKNIQHLWTPVTGRLKPGTSIFDIIDDIHPTPAVCGVPCKDSLELIKSFEKHNRGLYSGALGWFNFNNEAELAVGIRSALLKDNKLFAYSGCGIVDGSDPATEYEESNLKLKPILSLFENEN